MSADAQWTEPARCGPNPDTDVDGDQVVADHAEIVEHVKATVPGAANCPAVAFGGSYGGTLTALMRASHPNSIVGGLAASSELGYCVPTRLYRVLDRCGPSDMGRQGHWYGMAGGEVVARQQAVVRHRHNLSLGTN